MSTTTTETPPKTRGLTRLTDEQKEQVEANLGLVYTIAFAMTKCRLPEPDRVQAGMLGLMRAVQLFDPTRGFQLSTYAQCHIKVYIRRAEHNDATIRTPHWTAYKKPTRASTARLIAKAAFAGEVASLDAFETDQTASHDDPAAPLERAEGLRLIHWAIQSLSDRDREIVLGRYWDGETLKQIGRRSGSSRETIRLIETKALARLRGVLESEFMEGD
jgi:RNA polymerase sigma factor (sigma-70 family)